MALETSRSRQENKDRSDGPGKGLSAPGPGDEFQQFAAAILPALLKTALALVHDPYLAGDVVQETLLRTFRQWSRARAAPEAYSRVTLANVCRDHWRRLQCRPREVSVDTLAAETHDCRDGWERAWAESDALERALRSLGRRQREVLVMRFILEFSVSEAAGVLGVPAGTVKSLTHRALERLREALEGLEPGSSRRAPDLASHTVGSHQLATVGFSPRCDKFSRNHDNATRGASPHSSSGPLGQVPEARAVLV